MAVDDGTKTGNLWPLPKFSFLVKIGPDEVAFQEVSGLDTETQVIEYRTGSSKIFSTAKLPGLRKFGNITMKKGVCKGDNVLFDWFEEVKTDRVARKSITISLLDANAAVTMIWSVVNAFPVKIIRADLKAEGDELAVEMIEFAHEGITMQTAT